MLGSLQRSHQERADLARRMADMEREENRHNLADRLELRAREYEEDAQVLMQLIRRGFGQADGATTDKRGVAKGNGED
jgi:two-component system chemotaxis response regulator CheB